MKAFTFVVRFTTAQFKEHGQRLTRKTYLIPPPSAVAGFFGAVMGFPRKKMQEVSEILLAGAELRSLEGRIITYVRIMKSDRPCRELIHLLNKYYSGAREKETVSAIMELYTIKESEELYKPEYKFAIASPDEELIWEGMRRVKELDFEFDVFGGNDYHFVEYIGSPKPASVLRCIRGRGYCRSVDFGGIEASSYSLTRDLNTVTSLRKPLIIPSVFFANVNEEFMQVYGADIVAKRELEAVNDGESCIFVHRVAPFMLVRGL